jgi:formylglycine-generating enzyme required for sulfatase activity/energy-coupling factor transporter ATP-binding protein EcfA2
MIDMAIDSQVLSSEKAALSQLREVLVTYFSESELRTLAFELGINYDALPGRGTNEKAIEIILYCERRQLVRALKAYLFRQRPFLINLYPPDTDETAPFKGLEYFDTADAHLFFGRSALVQQIIQHLKEHNFLGIIGASGSGKSSLVRAGVVPHLNAESYLCVITPTEHPLESLATALTANKESVLATAKLLDEMQQDGRTLDLYLKKQWAGQTLGSVVLMVDQFEELFTMCQEENERSAFIENLLTAVSPQTPSSFKIIITLRDDFYHHCGSYPRLRQALEASQKYIGPMQPEELKEAIIQPAWQNGLEIEPGLVKLLLDDTQHEPGALPFLSHALLEIWKRRQGKVLAVSSYLEIGRVQGAVANTAESIYTQLLSPAQQPVARDIFLQLTKVSTNGPNTRRSVHINDLTKSFNNREDVQNVIQILENARLIVRHQQMVQVTHEAVIRGWPRLHKWLEERKETILLHRQLAKDVKDWLANSKDKSRLYRGNKLSVFHPLLEKNIALTTEERAFLEASKALEKSRLEEMEKVLQIERREKWLARAVTALVLLVVGVSTAAIWEPLQAGLRINQAREEAKGPDVVELDAVDAILGWPQSSKLDTIDPGTYFVPAFAIEPYEVTNGRYQLCVDFGPCSPPNELPSEFLNEEKENWPVTHVTAVQAMQFCQWIGRTLPTDIQWERAARGENGRVWPWEGDEPPTPNHANINFGNNPEDVQEVGLTTKGATPEGVYDLVGNVLEWTRSPYDPNEPEWAGLPDDPTRILSARGGSYLFSFNEGDISLRTQISATTSHSFVGFRCVEQR